MTLRLIPVTSSNRGKSKEIWCQFIILARKDEPTPDFPRKDEPTPDFPTEKTNRHRIFIPAEGYRLSSGPHRMTCVWEPLMLELHRYFPAILLDLTWELESQLEVERNDDGPHKVTVRAMGRWPSS